MIYFSILRERTRASPHNHIARTLDWADISIPVALFVIIRLRDAIEFMSIDYPYRSVTTRHLYILLALLCFC